MHLVLITGSTDMTLNFSEWLQMASNYTEHTNTTTTVIYWHFGNRYIYIRVITIRKKKDVT